jgi:tetratricopeptide (TPR) repeat protein
MIENNNLSELFERAQTEENLYNWAEAVKLYEEVGKLFLNKKKLKETANAYKALGRIYFLISETADTKAEFHESLTRTIETYNKAANLFEQNKNNAAHFDARRSIYAYCFFANIGEYGNSLIYTPEKERTERTIPPKEEGLIYKDIDLFKLRSERKKWQKIHEKEKKFIKSTR